MRTLEKMTARPRSALLVIDVQRGLLNRDGAWDEVIPRIQGVVERARKGNCPVVFIQHGGPPGDLLESGSEGWQIHPALAPREEDVVIEKRWSDSFRETELESVLRNLGVTRVVVTGAQTEHCVNATVRRAASLGFNVTLVEDAHTTFDSGGLTREAIIRQHNTTLPSLVEVEAMIEVAAAAQVDLD
jgi:nicotinamidase-related amidase